jgi:hypothetical protein
MSDEVEALAGRFPEHAATIRRLYARDPNFHSICDDLADVRRAVAHWQTTAASSPRMVEEYRQMVKELEAEALAILQAFENKQGG